MEYLILSNCKIIYICIYTAFILVTNALYSL